MTPEQQLQIQKRLSSMSLRQQFYDLAMSFIVDIESPGVPVSIYASYYVVMSQYLKQVKIGFGSKEKDLRLHFFWIQNSRTGKGEMYYLTRKVAEAAGLRCTKVTRISDAGLIGGIDEFAIASNYKRHLQEGDDGYISPAVIGDLGNFDIIFVVESKQLLEPQTYNMTSMQILQEAMDYPGEVRVKLKHRYDVNYESTTSIYATTYYLGDSIESNLLTTGFFQRTMPYMKDLSIQENERLRKAIIDKFLTRQEEEDIYKYKFEQFVARLRSISPEARMVYLDKTATEELHKILARFHLELKTVSGETLKVLISFSQTIIDICTRVGAIHAVTEGRAVVRGSDISQSYVLVRAMSNTVINKLGSSEKRTDITVLAKKVRVLLEAKPERKMLTLELAAEIAASQHMSRHKASVLIDKLLTENYLTEERGDRNSKFLTLPKEEPA